MGVRNLYDEARVRALAEGSELVLGPGDLATPAALDLAFAKRIRVRRASDRPAPAQKGAPGDGAWRAMLRQDGHYVVVVKEGRAVVHRLTESGPLRVEEGS